MRKLDRYLATTVASMIALASMGLIGLFFVFTFLDQIGDIEGNYTLIEVFHYVALSTPRMFYETLPYAVLIGCLTGLGQLANNSELIVMRAAGVSTWRIARATLQPALVFVAIGLIVGELVLPDVERNARVVRENAMEDDITPQGGFWYREGDTIIHSTTVSHTGDLSNITQYQVSEENQITRTLWAERARYSGDGSWLLENVIITVLDNDKTAERLPQMSWQTTLTPRILSTEILVEPNRMSISELGRKIEQMKKQDQNTDKFELGLWSKLLQPIASLSLVLVAISFIFGPLRTTSMGMRVVSGLSIGILFKFVQDLLSPASLVYGFPPLFATLVPILLCTTAGYYLLRRAN